MKDYVIISLKLDLLLLIAEARVKTGLDKNIQVEKTLLIPLTYEPTFSIEDIRKKVDAALSAVEED